MTNLPPPDVPDLDVPDLDTLIERSARRGARLALAELGLDDDHAPKDIRDLRDLLVNWRRVHRHALAALTRLAVHIVMVALLAMATLLLWFSGR
ncbi:MAG: hypothetical protein J4F41_10090 [Alphaproteobacteria bacterium]|nr:hypothetical protein [Alphaproteobacteria bacterium]